MSADDVMDAYPEPEETPEPAPKVEIHDGTVRGWPLYVSVGTRVVADIPGKSEEDARPTAEFIAAAYRGAQEVYAKGRALLDAYRLPVHSAEDAARVAGIVHAAEEAFEAALDEAVSR